METGAEIERFSLLGGPLYRLGSRLGLVRHCSNTLPLGLAMGGLLWVALLGVAAIDHQLSSIFTLSVLGGHVRLLVVIPLLFLTESWLDPRMATFVSSIVCSGVVPASATPALNSAIVSARRWKDSWLIEAMCLAVAIVLTAFGSRLNLPGATSGYDPLRAVTGVPLTGIAYSVFALTVFRFLMLRMLWHVVLWIVFLSRAARLNLNLIVTHPDLAGGLGYLELVQINFAPVIVALSALQASSMAEEIATGSMALQSALPALAMVLGFDAILILGPVLFFTPRMWACRVKGMSDYMGLAADYVNRFDRKWVNAAAPPDEPLLGTPDLQSLADLSNSVSVARNMRWAPVSLRMVRDLTMAALLPMLPLLLFKYPLSELSRKFFSRLTGL
jgi:hypothetical protein